MSLMKTKSNLPNRSPELARGLFIDYWDQVRSVDKLHLNERGHALAAQEIASQILNQRNLYFGGQPAELAKPIH